LIMCVSRSSFTTNFYFLLHLKANYC
jgi:hypothetical protein